MHVKSFIDSFADDDEMRHEDDQDEVDKHVNYRVCLVCLVIGVSRGKSSVSLVCLRISDFVLLSFLRNVKNKRDLTQMMSQRLHLDHVVCMN